MVAKLTRLTHKIAIQQYLVTAVPVAVLAPGGQSGNFWIYPCTISDYVKFGIYTTFSTVTVFVIVN